MRGCPGPPRQKRRSHDINQYSPNQPDMLDVASPSDTERIRLIPLVHPMIPNSRLDSFQCSAHKIRPTENGGVGDGRRRWDCLAAALRRERRMAMVSPAIRLTRTSRLSADHPRSTRLRRRGDLLLAGPAAADLWECARPSEPAERETARPPGIQRLLRQQGAIVRTPKSVIPRVVRREEHAALRSRDREDLGSRRSGVVQADAVFGGDQRKLKRAGPIVPVTLASDRQQRERKPWEIRAAPAPRHRAPAVAGARDHPSEMSAGSGRRIAAAGRTGPAQRRMKQDVGRQCGIASQQPS